MQMRPFLVKKLEEAYSFIVEEKKQKGVIDNPLVISYLANKDYSIKAYLIAKDPNSNMFFGLMDTNLFPINFFPRTIGGIPSKNIESMQLVYECAFKPFRLKKFIEENIIEYHNEDIIKHFLFMNPQLQKEMNYIYHKPNENVFDTTELLSYLVYKDNIESLPIMFMRTSNAIDISGKDTTGNYLFKYKIGFIGLPEVANPIDLMEQLITHCYKIKDIEEFFHKAYLSNNPLLIHFAEEVKKGRNKCISMTHEIVDLLNMPELNPVISYEDIIYGKTNSKLLIFNKFAYGKLFKNFMT